MKILIVMVLFFGILFEKLVVIVVVGFDGIEIFEQDFIVLDFSFVEVGCMVCDYGFEIMLFQFFCDFEGLLELYCVCVFGCVVCKFELMNQFGMDLVLFCFLLYLVVMGGIDCMVVDFNELGDLVV